MWTDPENIMLHGRSQTQKATGCTAALPRNPPGTECRPMVAGGWRVGWGWYCPCEWFPSGGMEMLGHHMEVMVSQHGECAKCHLIVHSKVNLCDVSFNTVKKNKCSEPR